jgi:hypothetical protein
VPLCSKRLNLEHRELHRVSGRTRRAAREHCATAHAAPAAQVEADKVVAEADKLARIAERRKVNLRRRQAETVRSCCSARAGQLLQRPGGMGQTIPRAMCHSSAAAAAATAVFCHAVR